MNPLLLLCAFKPGSFLCWLSSNEPYVPDKFGDVSGIKMFCSFFVCFWDPVIIVYCGLQYQPYSGLLKGCCVNLRTAAYPDHTLLYSSVYCIRAIPPYICGGQNRVNRLVNATTYEKQTKTISVFIKLTAYCIQRTQATKPGRSAAEHVKVAVNTIVPRSPFFSICTSKPTLLHA